jgi:hypothetical protein
MQSSQRSQAAVNPATAQGMRGPSIPLPATRPRKKARLAVLIVVIVFVRLFFIRFPGVFSVVTLLGRKLDYDQVSYAEY